MTEPDYSGYTQSLEAVRDGLLRDYWVGLVDINGHQINVGRNYLWVSAALVGAYATVFDRYGEIISSTMCLQLLSALSFLLAAISFGVCLYAIPARKGYIAIPNQGWGEFSKEAYNILKKGDQNVYATFLTQHIAKIDEAYAHNFHTNRSRARLLRFTSWLLIVSFTITLVVGIMGTTLLYF